MIDSARSPTHGDPAESLAALSRVSAARLGLQDPLTRVVLLAVRAIPGADGAGLTLIEAERADTAVTSEPFVKQVDDIQYDLGEGPCISAAATGETMRSGSLGGDHRWPRFGPRAGQLGVHSVLSLPLISHDAVLGTINVYAHDRDAFDERSEQMGQLFAAPAAIAMQNALILARTQRLVAGLQAALTGRAVIGHATGILASRIGVTPEQALDRIRQLSQHQDTTMVAVATSIVQETVRRA